MPCGAPSRSARRSLSSQPSARRGSAARDRGRRCPQLSPRRVRGPNGAPRARCRGRRAAGSSASWGRSTSIPLPEVGHGRPNRAAGGTEPAGTSRRVARCPQPRPADGCRAPDPAPPFPPDAPRLRTQRPVPAVPSPPSLGQRRPDGSPRRPPTFLSADILVHYSPGRCGLGAAAPPAQGRVERGRQRQQRPTPSIPPPRAPPAALRSRAPPTGAGRQRREGERDGPRPEGTPPAAVPANGGTPSSWRTGRRGTGRRTGAGRLAARGGRAALGHGAQQGGRWGCGPAVAREARGACGAVFAASGAITPPHTRWAAVSRRRPPRGGARPSLCPDSSRPGAPGLSGPCAGWGQCRGRSPSVPAPESRAALAELCAPRLPVASGWRGSDGAPYRSVTSFSLFGVWVVWEPTSRGKSEVVTASACGKVLCCPTEEFGAAERWAVWVRIACSGCVTESLVFTQYRTWVLTDW